MRYFLKIIIIIIKPKPKLDKKNGFDTLILDGIRDEDIGALYNICCHSVIHFF